MERELCLLNISSSFIYFCILSSASYPFIIERNANTTKAQFPGENWCFGTKGWWECWDTHLRLSSCLCLAIIRIITVLIWVWLAGRDSAQCTQNKDWSFSNYKAEICAGDEFTVSFSKTFSSVHLKIKVPKGRFHSRAVEESSCVLQRTFQRIDLKRTISS